MRRSAVALLTLVIAVALSAPTAALAQDEGEGDTYIPPPDDTEVEAPTTTVGAFPADAPTTTVSSGPSTTVLPAGCPLPPAAHAVFTGRLIDEDATTGRFRVIEEIAGSLDGFQASGLVDVVFGEDLRFLELQRTYIVAAGIDDETGRLVSHVAEQPQMFGGNEVVGADDLRENCPSYADPLISQNGDGTPIETGVIAPLLEEKGRILRSFLLPAGVAFAVLVVLVASKRVLTWLGRRGGKAWRRHRATTRIRRRLGGRMSSVR